MHGLGDIFTIPDQGLSGNGLKLTPLTDLMDLSVCVCVSYTVYDRSMVCVCVRDIYQPDSDMPIANTLREFLLCLTVRKDNISTCFGHLRSYISTEYVVFSEQEYPVSLSSNHILTLEEICSCSLAPPEYICSLASCVWSPLRLFRAFVIRLKLVCLS